MAKRLTKKGNVVYSPTARGAEFLEADDGSNAARLLQVIGPYEDIEDEWECPIEIVFKALKNGFYDGCGKFIECPELSGTSQEGWIIGNALTDYQFFRLRDYGKKGPDGWALTMEEFK